jgi:TatD DNase family protein
MSQDDQILSLSNFNRGETSEIAQKLGDISAARLQVKSARDGLVVSQTSKISYSRKLKIGEDTPNNPKEIKLIDTHAHIHDPEFKFEHPDQVIEDAKAAGVSTILVVGTSVNDSFLAAEFALQHEGVYAVIGSHPHEAKKDLPELRRLEEILKNPKLKAKVVGVGEIGLDYYYNNSRRHDQMKSLRFQLGLAEKYNLPVSFHVREAYGDFWPIYNNFKARGVLHSFTDSIYNMEKALEAGLFFGLNGISTFTKDAEQLKMFNSLPLERIILETDAPFLTPAPHRGKMNVSAYVKLIAEDISNKRGISLAEVASATTNNACFLFNLPRT